MSRASELWSIITSRVFFVISIMALLAVSTGVVNVWLRNAQIEREVEALRSDIRQAEGKNEELRRLINYFSTPEFREREARLRLGLQKPGENVVVVPGNESLTGGSQPSNGSLPNWRRWYNYFFVRR